MNIVYVVLRVDKNNGDQIVWKVYDSEEKAKSFCERWADVEERYRYRYEDWWVK